MNPRQAVLETAALPLNYCPIYQPDRFRSGNIQIKSLFDFCFLVINVLTTERTIFAQFQLTGYVFSVFVSRIILPFAFCTLKSDNFYCPFFFFFFLIILKSPRAESNCRPQPYHGCALPTELQGQSLPLTLQQCVLEI